MHCFFFFHTTSTGGVDIHLTGDFVLLLLFFFCPEPPLAFTLLHRDTPLFQVSFFFFYSTRVIIMHFFVRFFCMSSGFEIRSVCRMEQQTGFFLLHYLLAQTECYSTRLPLQLFFFPPFLRLQNSRPLRKKDKFKRLWIVVLSRPCSCGKGQLQFVWVGVG